MHLVTVQDSATGQQYSYDADMKMQINDDGIAFYLSQTTVLDPKIYEVKYRNIVYQDFVPIDTSDPEWVDTVSYISYDAVTMGKFIAANGKDLPQSDITASISQIPVGYAGNSYQYSLEELRKSQQMRIPLDVTKARMTYRGAQEHMQQVAFYGDAGRGMTGLFNNPNLATDNSVINWASAPGQDIVSDMNSLLISVWKNSANVHIPNVLILPADKWAFISSKRMDTGTDTTVLTFFMENNLYTQQTGLPLAVKSNLELQTAGAAGKPMMLAYELTEENLTLRQPIPWRSLAPQSVGLTIQIPCEYKTSGVEWRYPGSAAYRVML